MRHLFNILLFLAGLFSLFAAQAENGFQYREQDTRQWSETVDGEQFREATPDTEVPEMQEVPVRTISTGWLQILGYTLIIGILAVIIFYLLRSRIAGNRRVAAGDEIRIEDLDQRPMESDLDRLLREAVRNEDWRLAFRIQYLLVIRALHDTGRIIWKREKTNHDYVRELGLHPLADDLHTESLVFDRIWYGLRPMDHQGYLEHSNKLQRLIQRMEAGE